MTFPYVITNSILAISQAVTNAIAPDATGLWRRQILIEARNFA
jgi:hypothetical protein